MSCYTILKSGKNKGLVCGRVLPCRYHKSIQEVGAIACNSLFLLPEELVLIIFKYLKPVEKLLPSLVCKSWYSILGIVDQTACAPVLNHYLQLPTCFLECTQLHCSYVVTTEFANYIKNHKHFLLRLLSSN